MAFRRSASRRKSAAERFLHRVAGGLPGDRREAEEAELWQALRIAQMEAEGVKFLTNTEVGVNHPAKKLLDAPLRRSLRARWIPRLGFHPS